MPWYGVCGNERTVESAADKPYYQARIDFLFQMVPAEYLPVSLDLFLLASGHFAIDSDTIIPR